MIEVKEKLKSQQEPTLEENLQARASRNCYNRCFYKLQISAQKGAL